MIQNIYVVTHGQSLHHLENRVGGWYDTGLTELGRMQAELTTSKLFSVMAEPPSLLVSSDLRRAAETAEIIGKSISLDVQLDAGFRESGYGIAEGKPQYFLNERIITAPGHNRLDHQIIEGAETKRIFAERIYKSMSKLPDQHDVIIVTHGYALTFIVASWVGMRIDDVAYVNFAATPCGITYLQKGGLFNNKTVNYLNNTSHLFISK